jgi:UDP-N-acetylmuramyl-tripeptide synthetase
LTLNDLIAASGPDAAAPAGDTAAPACDGGDAVLAGLTCDSRTVEPGYLFAALPGATADGRRFIRDAVAAGAVAVLVPADTDPASLPDGVPVVTDRNARRRFARMAGAFYPERPETLCAVTGTNGKTSVASFLRQIWKTDGRCAASLGTLGVETDSGLAGGGLTTPDPVALHATLSRLAADGVTCAALEASSHGLDQFRLDGLSFKAAGFTNLSRDHLDYHETMADYAAAKARLFRHLLAEGGVAVLNRDDPVSREMSVAAQAGGADVVTYGRGSGAAIRLLSAAPTAHGQSLAIQIDGSVHMVDLPLIGDFQVENALCALGLALASGVGVTLAVAALGSLTGAPGRLETVGATPAGAAVVVDYAHTPDALATVLAAVRPHTQGRVLCVFGCGGDRDPGKRPEMGRAAGKGADVVIVTDDNPRSEDPAAIRAEALVGAHETAAEIIEEGGRRAAIRRAIALAETGDTVVIAGKGHETGQTVDGVVHPFDDRDEARAAIAGGRS